MMTASAFIHRGARDPSEAREPRDARRLGVLGSIIRNELNRNGSSVDLKLWNVIEADLHRAVAKQTPEPLISHLPSLPGHCDPIFLAWGFEYPGVVKNLGKYLRKAI